MSIHDCITYKYQYNEENVHDHLQFLGSVLGRLNSLIVHLSKPLICKIKVHNKITENHELWPMHG